MTSAPKWGDGVQQGKMKPSRLAPEGFEKKSNSYDPVHSALDAQNQEQPTAARKPPPHVLMPARIRRQQISKLLWHRHCGPCRTDKAGLYFEAIAAQLVICCVPSTLDFAVSEWVSRHTPNLAADVIKEVMDRFRSYQRVSYRSEDLGRHLQVTAAEKELLHLTHLGAIGVTAQEIAEQRRTRNRERMRAKRLATGETKTPRDQCIARTVEKREGESKTALYERVKRERQATLA